MLIIRKFLISYFGNYSICLKDIVGLYNKYKLKSYMTKAIISGLRCVNEGHEFLKKT